MQAAIREATEGHASFLDASRLATRLMGDSIATNLFLLGHAYQKGLVPLSAEAIARAIELNGVAVAQNLDTFRWGRLSASDPTPSGAPPASRTRRKKKRPRSMPCSHAGANS